MKNRNKSILTICEIGLIGLLWLALAGCQKNTPAIPPVAKKESAKPVKVLVVRPKTLQETLEVTGTLFPENTANIISTTEGKITQLNVREGDLVQQDQIVAQISSLLREDVITAARLKVESLEQEAQQKPQDALINAQLKEARENYAFALNQYKEMAIVSPITGIISKRFVDLGDMVAAKTKLLEVTSADRFNVNLTVAETDLRKLHLGQKAALSLDACPDQKFSGTVTRIYPEIDAITRNGIIEVHLDNPCPNTKSGMFVRATFITKVLKDVVALPRQAIVNITGNKAVYIVPEDMKAKLVMVKTGFETANEVEITSGVKIGDRVVIEGQETLKNGAEVKIQKDKKETGQ